MSADDGVVDVYLDVDGVLNALSPKAPEHWGWGKGASTRAQGFPIQYAPALIERLNAFAGRKDVAMHWLTTWEHHAPVELCPRIGLRGQDWPVLVDPRVGVKFSDYSWWKWHAVKGHYKDRRAVWIDDDLIDSTAREWGAPMVQAGRLLLVQPSTDYALTKDEFDAIEAWVDPS